MELGRIVPFSGFNSRLKKWIKRDRLPGLTYDKSVDDADEMVE